MSTSKTSEVDIKKIYEKNVYFCPRDFISY